jgi:hypothetical protein
MIVALVLGIIGAIAVWRLCQRVEGALTVGVFVVLAAWVYSELHHHPAALAASAAPQPQPARTVIERVAPAAYHGPNGLEITIIVIVAILFAAGASIGTSWWGRR